MATIQKMPYGTTAAGEAVSLYRLTNAAGASADIITYGGTIVSLNVPGRDKMVDVVLGYDNLADYEKGDKYLGALIGRFGNRIGGGRFTLNGKEYVLNTNEGKNHLHGGNVGFDKRVWNAEEVDGSLRLTYHSPDGEEGYPGNLDVTVTYCLTDDNELSIEYQAVSDADTVCNLTNHSYFNLAGNGNVLNQWIQVFSDAYLTTDEGSIPTGELAPVVGTPLDLRMPVRIGEHIDDDFAQLRYPGGYDHCWVLWDRPFGELRPMALAYSEESGILMTAYTTLPSVQFYAGNYLDGVIPGKIAADGGRVTNERRGGFCLESEFYPDAPHLPNAPSAVLAAGKVFRSQTIYRFSVR